MNLPKTTAVLKRMSKPAAREWIVSAFHSSEVDANDAFALASECDIELDLVAVEPTPFKPAARRLAFEQLCRD